VSVQSNNFPLFDWPSVVTSIAIAPVLLCMGAQKAGVMLRLEGGDYAMISGLGRVLAAGRTGGAEKELFAWLGISPDTNMRQTTVVVEYNKTITRNDAAKICHELNIGSHSTIVQTPTKSIRGLMQIASRATECALLALKEVGFPIRSVSSAQSVVPLAPAGGRTEDAMYRSNEVIRFGGNVTLWADVDESSMALAESACGNANPYKKMTFKDVCGKFNYNFSAMPMTAFSPAIVTIHNVRSGRAQAFGELAPLMLRYLHSATEVEGWKDAWSECLSEDDCVLISYGVGCYTLGAVNKKFLEVASVHLAEKSKSESCSTSIFDRLTRSLRCEKGKCALQ
jgi:methenyltetrahydromethanopterin cyclohydrolase